MVGGEALGENLVRWWREHAPETEVINEYGPTEATVGCSTYRCEGREEGAWVPMGRGIEGAELYVLDENQEPVPVGVAGEVNIGGRGVARGYHGDGRRSGERFVPDGLSGRRGARLYRSGDLAKWQEDGNLMYLGRMDNQVKVRGYRVELGEIEAVLRRHPYIKDAVVVSRHDVAGGLRLIAYLVSQEGAENSAAVQDSLRAMLPEYMVPSIFLWLPGLPRSLSGKIDHQALPNPADHKMLPEAPFAKPETDMEWTVAKIWQEVLGVDQVGRHDNFFEVGGHSLLLVNVFERLRPLIKRKFAVVDLFEYPTVAKLSAFLATENETPDFSYIQARARKQSQ